MNTDYNIMTRIIANRLRPYLPALFHPSQHCGVQGSSVFEAVATVRYAIAYTEITKKPLCVVSLDFSAAFDNISHAYLQEILSTHGFINWFSERIIGDAVRAAVASIGLGNNLAEFNSSPNI